MWWELLFIVAPSLGVIRSARAKNSLDFIHCYIHNTQNLTWHAIKYLLN